MTAPVRASIRAAPCEASRKAVSCAITSSGQARRVVASWPMRTMLPLVPYVPLNWLQPANPPRCRSRTRRRARCRAAAATIEPGAFAVRVDDPPAEQRVLGRGIEHEQRLAPGPKIVSVLAARAVEAALAEQGEVGGLEVHRRLDARHQRAGRVRDEQRPAPGAIQGVVAVAAAEPGDPVRVELGVRVLGVGDEREGRVDQVGPEDPLGAVELAAAALAAGAGGHQSGHDDQDGDQPGLHPRPLARFADYRDWLDTQSANSRRK